MLPLQTLIVRLEIVRCVDSLPSFNSVHTTQEIEDKGRTMEAATPVSFLSTDPRPAGSSLSQQVKNDECDSENDLTSA